MILRAPSRRLLLASGLALAAAPFPARATPEAARAAMRAFAGGAEPRRGRVELEMPTLVENGNAVPTVVRVDSPMTEEDHVVEIALFNERNPLPDIARFHLGPRCGEAWVSTRIRLGDTQTVHALARMKDGSVWAASAELIVTLPACIEG
jgi:sulfur-oxidizing protein SoxY